MRKLMQMDVSSSCSQYLESVGQNVSGLYEHMLRLVRTRGSLSAVVPEGTTLMRAEQFDAGGLLRTSEAEDWLLDRIEAYARRATPAILLVQDFWFNEEDYKTHPLGSELWIDDGQVYLWEELGADRSEQLRLCLRRVKSFYFGAFLVEGAQVAIHLRTGVATIDELATEAVEIYIPAYDQESYVIWTRDGGQDTHSVSR